MFCISNIFIFLNKNSRNFRILW